MLHPPRTVATLAFLAFLAAAAPAFADDDVDLQVRGNESVVGTLRPADERESFLVDAPRGALVTASVKRTGDGGPTPLLELIDASSAVVAAAVPNAKGGKLARFELPASGSYRLRVAGDGALDGDYQFKVKLAARASWGERDGAPLDAGASADFSFAAPPGATADLTLAAAKESAFLPRIVSIDGPAGYHRDVDAAGVAGTRHRASRVPLGAAGEYVAHLRNDGAAAGAWTISVRVAAPRISRTNVDISDSALTGSFGGDDQVFGRVVDAAGALVDPTDDGGPLDGASVSVPANAMTSPTVIAISASDTFFVDDTDHPAGVAISLTPAGTVFAAPVTVTVPYDPQAFDDPASELRIYIQDAATGALEAVPQASLVVDTVANSVSFLTAHFSRFQSASPRPRAFKGQFVQLELGGAALDSFGGGVVFGLSRVDGLKGPRNGNGFTRNLDRRLLTYDANSITRQGYATSSPMPDAGTVALASDEVLTLMSQVDGPVRFVRGRHPDALIQPPSQMAQAASTSLLLRVAKGAPTLANLAGDWNAAVFEFRAARGLGGGTVLGTTGQRLKLRFELDGSVRAGPTSTLIGTPGGAGAWAVHEERRRPPPGTVSLAQSAVILDMQLGTSPLATTVRLVPVLRGDALVGIADGDNGSKPLAQAALRAVFLVREAAAAGPALVQGRALFSSFGLLAVDRPGQMQDLTFQGDDLTVLHDGVRASAAQGSRVTIAHDATGAPQPTALSVGLTGQYFVAPDGAYRETSLSVLGAVAPRGGVYLATRFTGPFVAVGFGVVAPPKP